MGGGLSASNSSSAASAADQKGGNIAATFGDINLGGSKAANWLPYAVLGVVGLLGFLFFRR